MAMAAAIPVLLSPIVAAENPIRHELSCEIPNQV